MHRPTSPPNSPCVLIADDHVEFANGLARVLCSQGLRVKVVHSGTAVIDYVTSALGAGATSPLPDAIVSDLNMPGCSGFEVMDVLEALVPHRPNRRAPPFLLMTAESTWAVEKRAFEQGATRVLFKPFTMDHFLAELAAALGGYEGPSRAPRSSVPPFPAPSVLR